MAHFTLCASFDRFAVVCDTLNREDVLKADVEVSQIKTPS